MAKIDLKIRRQVYERDNFTCSFCSKKVILTKDIKTSEDYKLEATLDHIKPVSKGGNNSEENLRTLCRSCNAIKGDRENPNELKFLSINRGEFTMVANAIIAALARTKLNSEESRILFAIISKTYGFKKAEDWVSNSQLEEITGMHRAHCSRTVTRLKERMIVTKTGNMTKFNKYFFEWKEIPTKKVSVTKTGNKKKLPKLVTNVTNAGTEVLPRLVYTKDITKDKKDSLHAARVPAGKRREKKPIEVYTSERLEEILCDMESKEDSHLNIIATYIREKPVKVENSQQLTLIISRFGKVASQMVGAYTNEQIFKAIDDIKKDNAWRKRKGEEPVDWGIETILKKLVKN